MNASTIAMPAADPSPFRNLTPDRIMDAIESVGLPCDGRLQALNSFENRVYQVGLDGAVPIIAKFYRPGRWRNEAIVEEHRFCLTLARAEVPVVAPIELSTGETLIERHGFRFALFPKHAGRAPELEDLDTLEWLGRFIARIHATGEGADFLHRPQIDARTYGDNALNYLMRAKIVPASLRVPYDVAAKLAIQRARERMGEAGGARCIRLHADCHVGNILWTDSGPHFVDFDDCRMGPAIQDLWMLLSGDREEMTAQLSAVLRGYRMFRNFDRAELLSIEPLRTLRMIHYAAWLAERFGDPAFPAAFPWFGTERYWQDQILALKEQIAAMDEPPLEPEGF
jgi:Ser/Thr protein kinase RdoA (MazF antagonist)